jgi:hypothetical protein
MRPTIAATVIVLAFFTALAVALPGKPDFAPHIYADGVAWGTKVTNFITHPDYDTLDKLYVIIGGNNMGQLPVGEAAPYEYDYDGGRWWTFTAEWTPEALSYYGTVPLLTSDDDVMEQESMGYMVVTEGSPPGGPPEFFHCPLVPVKDMDMD